MKVKMILPALEEAYSPHWRPIKYSLFPPLGLATLAGYLNDSDEITIYDEHVEKLDLSDEPDLVAIEVYITSAYRAYQIADHYRSRGVHVALGGLHVTSRPKEALKHADTIFIGPGEDTWPEFLKDFRNNTPNTIYKSTTRSLDDLPPIRRDLIKRNLYLTPNSIVVSRGCPHICDFCYKDSFFKGGKSFYTQKVDSALSEIERLPGRHLFFLDDNLFGDLNFASDLFDGMKGMNRVWQAAATVNITKHPEILKKAVECGLRSLFVGFETLSDNNLKSQNKHHNLKINYDEVVKLLHNYSVMINGSFVFGLDEDDESVFENTVNWAITNGIETATFHILTPYPGTALFERMESENRITSNNLNLYDTRHVVYQPLKLTADALENGYKKAYKDFYSWSSIFNSSMSKEDIGDKLRHFAYTSGWKKFEWFWDMVIKAKRLPALAPALEYVLDGASNQSKEHTQIRPRCIHRSQNRLHNKNHTTC